MNGSSMCVMRGCLWLSATTQGGKISGVGNYKCVYCNTLQGKMRGLGNCPYYGTQ